LASSELRYEGRSSVVLPMVTGLAIQQERKRGRLPELGRGGYMYMVGRFGTKSPVGVNHRTKRRRKKPLSFLQPTGKELH
jgi:hypothetical protein